jgi:hypothetical protein
MIIDDVFKALEFETHIDVTHRLSIADCLAKSKRCGIYMLAYADGTYYIGLSVDMARRFVEHKKARPDIVRVGIKPVGKRELDGQETAHIREAEAAGIPLTNRAKVTHIQGETDLDLGLNPEEQEEWIGETLSFWDEERQIDDDAQRRRYAHRFEQFTANEHADTVLDLLKHYVAECVPASWRTELSFWSVSCMPGTNKSSWPRLAAVSINKMEVFVRTTSVACN